MNSRGLVAFTKFALIVFKLSHATSNATPALTGCGVGGETRDEMVVVGDALGVVLEETLGESLGETLGALLGHVVTKGRGSASRKI